MALGAGTLTGTQQVAHAVEGPASSSLDRDPEMETQAGGKGGEHPMGLGSQGQLPLSHGPDKWVHLMHISPVRKVKSS